MIAVQIESLKSLLLKLYFNEELLGIATGFVVCINNHFFLLTNRHVVTGKDNNTGKCLHSTGAYPNRIEIWHNSTQIGDWIPKWEKLYDNDDPITGKPLWVEHPVLREKADVVAISLQNMESTRLYPYETQDPKVKISPCDRVSIIGFPYGISTFRKFPVWITGYTASEAELPYNDLPCFLVDARTRQAQSGSPVVFYRSPGEFLRTGDNLDLLTQPFSELIGIYSGRINEESDIGIVWKVPLIRDLLQECTRNGLPEKLFPSLSTSNQKF